VQGIDARCGSFVVPENRTKPNGRTIGLNVVVLPASLRPARTDAVAYLAGGPGDAATELAARRSQQLTVLNMHRDILLVDQRGTGRSKPDHVDATQRST
jgi:pimeloyl-ACP methyl ester carboxylesterase